MPFPKPKNKLDVIGQFHQNILELASQYQESKHPGVESRKPVSGEKVYNSLDEHYIRNRAERDALLKHQKEIIENSKHQKAINAKRQQELKQLHIALHSRFIKLNVFIKECDDKRKNAERHIVEQSAKHAQLRYAIEENIKVVDDLTAFREQIRATVLEYSYYDELMAEVVKESPIFESRQDCMVRCDGLLLTHDNISNHLHRLLQEAEDMRQFLIQSINNAKLQVMGLKTEMGEVERTFQEVRNDLQRWERISEQASLFVANNDLDKERAVDGVNQLYRMLCLHTNKKPVFTRLQMEQQLNFIREEVSLLKEVYQHVSGKQVPGASRADIFRERRLKKQTSQVAKKPMAGTKKATKRKIVLEDETESEAESDKLLPQC